VILLGGQVISLEAFIVPLGVNVYTLDLSENNALLYVVVINITESPDGAQVVP
jgi:hypothetical protein